MLMMLILCLPSLIVRHLILRRPVHKKEAFIVVFVIGLSCAFLVDGMVPVLMISAAAVISYLILTHAKKVKRRLRYMPDYTTCSGCELGQWAGNSACKRCGQPLEAGIGKQWNRKVA